MIFNKFNKVNVGYYFKYSQIVPRFLFKELSNNVGCPATASNKNRIFGLKPLITMEILFGLENGEPYYKYEFDKKNFKQNNNIHNVIKDMLVVQKQNKKCVLQIKQYIHLVTDDKNLEVSLFDPVEKNYFNCDFITGSFKPHSWIRAINASYIQNSNKEAKIKLNVNKDIYRLFFNKPVNIKEIIPNKKILRYENTIYNVAEYLKNLNNVYKEIVKLRPKKLL